MINAIVIYLSLVFVMSVVCFAAYGLDKRRAVNGNRRVPENTLHILALLGGWPGALLGQRQFRHKTSKFSFLIVFWLIVVLHVTISGAAAYVFFNSRTLDSFRVELNKELTPEEAEKLFGKPDRDVGSGLIFYEYELADGAKLRLGFPGFAPIIYAHRLSKDGKREELPLK